MKESKRLSTSNIYNTKQLTLIIIVLGINII